VPAFYCIVLNLSITEWTFLHRCSFKTQNPALF
jgi:hypothetical protein